MPCGVNRRSCLRHGLHGLPGPRHGTSFSVRTAPTCSTTTVAMDNLFEQCVRVRTNLSRCICSVVSCHREALCRLKKRFPSGMEWWSYLYMRRQLGLPNRKRYKPPLFNTIASSIPAGNLIMYFSFQMLICDAYGWKIRMKSEIRAFPPYKAANKPHRFQPLHQRNATHTWLPIALRILCGISSTTIVYSFCSTLPQWVKCCVGLRW